MAYRSALGTVWSPRGDSAANNSNELALLGLGGIPTRPVQRREPMTFMAGPANKRMAREVGLLRIAVPLAPLVCDARYRTQCRDW